MHVHTLGYWSEKRVIAFLRWQGCAILEHRYRQRGGEIDIIARQAELLLFVEVRCRRGHSLYGDGVDSITHAKQRRIVQTAQHYLATHQPTYEAIRFDLCTLTHPWRGRIQWLKGAFELEPYEMRLD